MGFKEVIYIEGYSLISALGMTIETSINALKKEKYYPKSIEGDNLYFFLKEPINQSYYEIIKKVSSQAIKNAKLNQVEIEKMGIFIGTSSPKLPINEKSLKEHNELLTSVNISEITNNLSSCIGQNTYRCIISTACTSSSNALVQAKDMIESGLIEKALVVGVELFNELTIKGFDSFQLLSNNKLQPFDKNRTGVILGEGISAVILGKSKSSFELVAGSIKLDISSITSPTANNLELVMNDALKKANITSNEIYAVKSHATATLQNDKVEAEALNNCFTKLPIISALKPYIGHTMGASGTNELVLMLGALKKGFIPKTINFKEQEDKGITPITEDKEAKYGYYMFNYFGFGGNNCSLIVKYNNE